MSRCAVCVCFICVEEPSQTTGNEANVLAGNRVAGRPSCDSLVLHCASLLQFSGHSRANERVQVHNVRDFPQTKLDSEINARFLLNDSGQLNFLLYNNSAPVTLLKKQKKELSERK